MYTKLMQIEKLSTLITTVFFDLVCAQSINTKLTPKCVQKYPKIPPSADKR